MSQEGPISPQEKSLEIFPNREEILLEIGKYCENPTVVQERTDEKGVFFLTAQVQGEKPGEILEYTYLREGDFGTTVSGRTSIFVTHLKDGEVVWAEDLTHYDSKTKKWE